MRMRWATSALLPFAAAGLATACSTDRVSNKGAASGNEQTAARPTISLTGCLAAAPGTNQYSLQKVRLAPLAEQASDAPSTQGFTITEGSWVKLTGSDQDDLKKHLGQEVSVTGTLTDDGRNTIGTSGQAKAPDEPEDRTDKSRAAEDEHHGKKAQKEAGPLGQQSIWNGDAPTLAVNRVAGTGQQCTAPPTTDRR